MNLKMKTIDLQEMTGRAIKGAGNNKLLPLTELMCIKAVDGQLSIITSDGSNYLYIKKIKVDGDFYVTVKADQFAKLVSKLTCENVEMTITNNALEIRANGVYLLDIPMDEEGEVINYPDPLSDMKSTSDSRQVNLSTIRGILESCKTSLAQTLEVPCYTGYYCGDRIIATDSDKIASLDAHASIFGCDVLVAPEVLNLVDVMTSEKLNFFFSGDYMVFDSPDCAVVGMIMDGIEEYPIEPITNILDKDLPSKCTLDKNALIALLDRISLFVGPYDDHVIRLTFTNSGINVESMQSNGVETINYLSVDDFKPFTCLADITFILTHLRSLTKDAITLQFGADNAIRFDEDDVTLITSLVVENN